MVTKAELTQDRADYTRCLESARGALRKGNFNEAIGHAVSSWPFIDGMMQFERKYESREFSSIESIDIVLQYAPLVFDTESLDKIQELLMDKKRVEKNTSDDLRARLAAARALMRTAHLFWNLAV